MRELEPRLFRYIWRYSKRDQIAICLVVLVSLPFYFVSLDLPKRIVNDAITGRAYMHNATATFLEIKIDWPEWLGGRETRIFEGLQLERIELLLALSGLFLLLVLINGCFKLWINLSKGVLGERMLRRLRFQLFSLMLRFTPQAQREVKASETATIIRDEVEPIGTFIGDAIVVPVFLGTQAATALIFIVMQNLWLGLVATGIVGIQIVVIPRLRLEIIRLSRLRQLASRAFAGRVGEVLEGLGAVTANNAGRWERAEIGARLYGLFDLRLRIYRRKFVVKYVNNLLTQVTPFLFYAIGGMFAIRGQLDIGQLVAVLAAYRDLPPPLKELIDWDQQRLDVEVKYETVAAHFSSQRLRATEEHAVTPPPSLGSPLQTQGLALMNPDGGQPLIWPDIEVALPARVALTSPGTLHAQGLAAALAGVQAPISGTIRIGGDDLAALAETRHAQRIAYAGPDPILFPGSIRANVHYGLHTRPAAGCPEPGNYPDRQRQLEAVRTGNPEELVDDSWIDLRALGLPDLTALDERVLDLLGRLGMADDLYRFGLGSLSVVTSDSEVGGRMIKARELLREHFATSGRSGFVIPFDPGEYNDQATIAENLLFGVPFDPPLIGRHLAEEPHFRAVLNDLGLLDELTAIGVRIARNLVEIFHDLPSGQSLFLKFSMVAPEEIPDLARRLAQLHPSGRLSLDDSAVFLALALPYVEPRQRLGLIDHEIKNRLVEARSPIQTKLQSLEHGGIEPYDSRKINPLMSILDNLLFGRIDTTRAHGEAEIQREVRNVVRKLGLGKGIRRRGLEFDVGNRGQFLSARQRAAIDLARALIRHPEIVVVDGALNRIHGGLAMILDARVVATTTVIAVADNEQDAQSFDRVINLLHP